MHTMRKICIYIISSLILLLPVAGLAFTVGTSGSSDLGSTDFMFNASQFFPTAGKDGKEPAKGLDNIDEILKLRTPVLVILMASIATLMVIAGGITLVAATGKADLAEKAK